MFPYRDENPADSIPIVTVLILVGTVLVWTLFQRAGLEEKAMAHALCDWGFIPGELTGLNVGYRLPITENFMCIVDPVANWATLVTTMFLHGGWLHLIGNMMFLWVFGNNIEDAMGHIRFLLFYLLCGVAAGLAQVLSDPSSPVPGVGASGAVSGILGAYLLLFPTARIWMVVPIVIYPLRFSLPAWTYLIYWAVIQFVSGVTEVATREMGSVDGGVAFWAHIGGFAAGMFLIHFFVTDRFLEKKRYRKKFHRWY